MSWLSRGEETDPKHRGWLHPLAVCLIHHLIVIQATLYMHDWLLATFSSATDVCNSPSPEIQGRRRSIVQFVRLYSIWILLWRLYFVPPRSAILYEYCWLCTMAVNMGWIGLWANRPIVAAAYCVTVGIDQLLWYVDLTIYGLFGFFPIGVSQYVFWKGTNWTTRVTCTHHLWTIPVLLYGAQGLHILALPLSFAVMVLNVGLSRWMVPQQIVFGKMPPRYLNVNLGHELWKDIRISYVQINYDDPPVWTYLSRLFLRWEGLNAIVFAVLYVACCRIWGAAPIC